MSFLADNVLNKVDYAKNRERLVNVGGANIGIDAGLIWEADTNRGGRC